MKKIYLIIFLSSMLAAQNRTVDQRVDSLLSLMTLEEKIGQTVQYSGGKVTGTKSARPRNEHIELIRKGKVGSFLNVFGANTTAEIQRIAIEESRLKIPLLFGMDIIHGYKTIFPVPIAEASSWDPELVKLSASLQAEEASSAGIHWTFSPMVDIARDPRWGRVVEGSGEDPFLGSVMAEHRVYGYQGNNLEDPKTIVACAKHFAAYGGAEGGRDYNTVDISERTLMEIYLPPFKKAVEAGVGTLMSSFNEINGIPSSANPLLLNRILRDKWNFNGFVVSDWNSIGELIQHGIAADLKGAAGLALNSGVDMDMESDAYFDYLKSLIEEGVVSEETLNQSVIRILKIKFRLGLFDEPFKYCSSERESNTVLNEKMIETAREVAKRSIVLLKNRNGLLPLSKKINKIAIIGPLADSKDNLLGPWKAEGDSSNVISILDGVKNKLANSAQIFYEKGCSINGESRNGFELARSAADQSDFVILCVGESRQMSGEARNRTNIDLPGIQEDLVKEMHKSGKPVIVVLINGRPLSINWISENVDAILEAWFPGIQTGNAIADVLFGDYNPSAKLPVTIPRSVGQIPIYYNHKNTGRPYNPDSFYTSGYIDSGITPLYPFGFGLSYTSFNYGKIKTDKIRMAIGDSLRVNIDITNSGKYDGEEVVQLYIRDMVGSVTRPVKELKDFRKVFIRSGEVARVEFVLSSDQFKFYDADMNYVVEPGKFKIFIGPDSVNLEETEIEVFRGN
ncbi:MAG TPA: beta-glucosidase BglX [Melioribacteraceae bacterium]|nr:beta-glucosidase BglX [Melioribacteraceae bacterium]